VVTGMAAVAVRVTVALTIMAADVAGALASA
jgi:hypothetical protein